MEAKTVQHAYFAGRSATGLLEGGHSAILESVRLTPFKKPSTRKVHPEEVPSEEVPVPEFRLEKMTHTLQVCEFLLETAEKLPCFEGCELVIRLPAEEASQSLVVAAYLAGLLLPRFPYEDSLETYTLAAVLKAGIVQRSETDLTLVLVELEVYIDHLTWHEATFEVLRKNEGNFQVPGRDLIYFDGASSSKAYQFLSYLLPCIFLRAK
ncbi:uncharacterized protein BBA_10187 [Beauveria bassiana ARSEF 2860]|uniref:Uncharacterized protein n=1 Tax=Beauveria bassiana (strain ARSEF 2860) TaxID=655819 RepID=J5J9W6_BEAB2|nr:uncharacterized protein BBA_10187 [Beauveria bassiana ARSEF 2860]EJP60866.1 hypothetical protein BBA_10187 [Beauveria bassiana ARSEF 2860]